MPLKTKKIIPYLVLGSLIPSMELSAKEYVFIGIPNMFKIDQVISSLENPENDRVSFVVPEGNHDEMNEVLEKYGTNVRHVSYIPGMSKEDVHNDLNIFDKNYDQVANLFGKMKQKLSDVDGIISASEYTIYPAARLRTEHDIPGLQLAQGVYFRDKYEMKERLNDPVFSRRQVSVPLPKYAALKEGLAYDDVLSNMDAQGIDFPIILKPRTNGGSLGIYLVKDKEQLQEIVQSHDSDELYELNEFIDEKVIHVNGVVQDGHVKVISSYEYGDTPLNNGLFGKNEQLHFELKGDDLSPKLYDIADEVVYRLGMDEGVFHLELFMSDEGDLTFLEIAARPPGGYVIPLVEVATGIHLHNINFLIDMNIENWKTTLVEKFKENTKFHGGYLTNFDHPKDIQVTRVDLSEIAGVDVDRTILPSVGDVITADDSSYKNLGVFIYSTAKREDLVKGYKNIRQGYIIEYKTLESD